MSEAKDYMTNTQQAYFNQESFMGIRLNTERVINKIELFLSSKRQAFRKNEKTGAYEEYAVTFGKPLANDEGINSILKLVEMTINEHTVQGNFTTQQYEDYLFYCRIEITKAIVTNGQDWEIVGSKLNMIIDNIMRFIEPVMTRLIDNKERDSYTRGIVQSKEVVVHEPNKGAVRKFTGGMGR